MKKKESKMAAVPPLVAPPLLTKTRPEFVITPLPTPPANSAVAITPEQWAVATPAQSVTIYMKAAYVREKVALMVSSGMLQILHCVPQPSSQNARSPLD